jgi:hypothetical protein
VTGDVAAGGDGSAVLGTRGSRFAAVRAGDVWFVVRQAPGAEADLRYDFGLVALKARAADGTWRDVLPVRPISRGRGDSAGPLLRVAGRTGAPAGTALRVGPHGRVTVTGGFRRADGRWLRRGVRFRYEALACGVRLEVPARAGDAYEYSAFTRPGDTLGDLAFDPQPTVTPAGRYSSGSDPRLSRLRLRFAAFRKRGRLTISTCTQR